MEVMRRGPGGVGVLFVALTACGRLGFDVDGDGGDGTGSMVVGAVDVRFDAVTTAVDRATDPTTAPSDGERLQIGDGTCPGYTGQTAQPYRAVVIQNGGTQPVTVSAWATCVAGDMAVLSYYRRGTPPRTRTERKNCVIGVAERFSPAAGATPCPGMLASSGRGLPLAVGEYAVVWLQAEGTGTLPTMLHIEVQ